MPWPAGQATFGRPQLWDTGPATTVAGLAVRLRRDPAFDLSPATEEQAPAAAHEERPKGSAQGGESRNRKYVRGARVLSVGIASAGLLTFVYFSVASHVLGKVEAKRIDLLWSVMFVIISVLYRPTEQLLSRTIAGRRARGGHGGNLATAIKLQGGFAIAFAVIGLATKEFFVDEVFEGHEYLYWILMIGTLAYAGSYFARGWLAGHERFGLYGALLMLEAVSRIMFAVVAALGITHGQTAVAAGIAAAPFISLCVVPAAFAHRNRRSELDTELEDAPITVDEADAALAGPGTEGAQEATHENLSLRRGGGFAVAVAAIMLSEQVLLNASVLTVDVTATDAALAGIVFNVMLIARAPLQLFQSIQTSLLPHLTGLEATDGHAAFAKAIRVTALVILAFAGAVAIGLLAIGPFVLGKVFGQQFHYNRIGLALVGIGMGFHLASGALNQAALARDRVRTASACWIGVAVLFLVWMFVPLVSEQLMRAESGYALAAGTLAVALLILYRSSTPAQAPAPATAAPSSA